ncbi:MAG: carbohydrate kinase [Sphaerochaetaceae bacterium]|nr:carbohydrate kinase [Sphaerochaetaceae bacterium]
MGTYVLGIDNGGTAIKASLYDEYGHEVATTGAKTTLIIEKPGFIERDMHALWKTNCDVIRSVLEKGKLAPSEIIGIAVTGHGNGLYAIDGKGEPVGKGILSADSRANSIVQDWYANGLAHEISSISCQDVWAGQPVAILSWMRINEPHTFERIAWILMCKDYIRYRLTGEIWAERTDYSGTNFVDPHSGEYSDQLLALFKLLDCRKKLPPIKNSIDYCGSVSKYCAQETGLAEGTPVYAGMFDIDANSIGMGITKSDMFCIIAGTWSINQCISTVPVSTDPPYRCTNYCIPGYWLITESSPTSASNLEWCISHMLDKSHIEGSLYEHCDKLVRETDPDSSNLLFLPFLYGSNVGPNASGGFLGLTGWHTTAQVIAAVYEGVAFSHRMHIDRLKTHFHGNKQYRVSGGAVRSHVWVQIFADVLQQPMEILENEEIGTLGAAMAAAVGAGLYRSFEEAANKMVRIQSVIEPRSDISNTFQRKYLSYCNAVNFLQDFWNGNCL